MQFFDPPGPEIPITWYFCDDNAIPLPFKTRFGSANWASDKLAWPGPGEVLGVERPWSDGSPPGPDVIVHEGGFFEGFAPTVGSRTSTSELFLHAGQTILVFVWSYRQTAWPGNIASITDLAGNVYTQDFFDRGAVDSRVRLDVWRARHTGNGIFTTVTIHFPGAQLFVSLGIAVFSGLLDQDPLALASSTGLAATPIAVARPDDSHMSRLVIASFSCGAMSALDGWPDRFEYGGSIITNGTKEDGNLVWQIQSVRHPQATLTWQATKTYEWVAAALIYEGEAKLRMPGTHFCGPQQYWEDGAPEEPPSTLETDQFGVSTCCGDYPTQLGCFNETDKLLLRVEQIYNKNPATLTVIGLELELEFFGGFWVPTLDSFGKVLPDGYLTLFFGCEIGPDGYSVLTYFGGSIIVTDQRASKQRFFPPHLLFWFAPIIPDVDPTISEHWDFSIAKIRA